MLFLFLVIHSVRELLLCHTVRRVDVTLMFNRYNSYDVNSAIQIFSPVLSAVGIAAVSVKRETVDVKTT